jgi:hypothetical protein
MNPILFAPWHRIGGEIYDSQEDGGNRVCDVMDHGNLNERCDLIAAAPELLEACRQAVMVMDTETFEHRTSTSKVRAKQQLENAIAKAEGRA